MNQNVPCEDGSIGNLCDKNPNQSVSAPPPPKLGAWLKNHQRLKTNFRCLFFAPWFLSLRVLLVLILQLFLWQPGGLETSFSFLFIKES